MLAWEVAALPRAWLAARSSAVAFMAFCFTLGFACRASWTSWHWYGFLPHNAASLVVVLGAGVAFNGARNRTWPSPRLPDRDYGVCSSAGDG